MAARLFHEQGYEATGIATILREVGINSGSLYHFFPGKDALLMGVLEWHMEALRPSILEPAEAASADPLERVFALLEHYRRGLLVSGCRRGCAVGNLALEVGDAKPQARALIDRYFDEWTGAVRGWLDAAGTRLPSSMDRGTLAGFVLAIMQGAVMQARAAGVLDPFDALVGHLRTHFDLLGAQARGDGGGRLAAGTDASTTESPSTKTDPEWRAW